MRGLSLFLPVVWATSIIANKNILFAAQSNGNLTSLSLQNSSIAVTSNTVDCADNASWLTLDAHNKILYCLNRGVGNATQGSLNSFAVGKQGVLTKIDRVSAPFGVVAGQYFDVGGKRGYVTASYNRSAIAVYSFGQNGDLDEPLQIIYPNISQTGPIPSRQDRSFSHHVILDPTGQFILIPDLGGDLIRVFKYDKENIAPLTELSPLVTEPGAGPRHAVFWKSYKRHGELFLFFNGELSQKVYSYKVTYTGTGLSFTKVFDVPALDAQLPSNTAPTSEIAISPDSRFLIVASRERSFASSPLFRTGPSDTLSTFKLNQDGTLSLVQTAPSGGYLPRQFSLNRKGDRVAVGHQGNNTVVVWKRDIRSGKIISEADGGKVGSQTLSGQVAFVQWYE
ncbi:Lactonase, 7-bladed beta-propeller-domain-containing protein [Pyrenochaeta sp. MPI-SDFR-AT-0127]|nr:Lactonase, 7-bladed beta-propeller-domain-containing protein [Pyrenochaeta sp. MPI-SDFR-AT-0127]